MPHFPKPFFKKARRSWYVEIDRKQINLGPDQTQAFDRYHELMRHRPEAVDSSLVVGVLDTFLAWVKQNRSARSYEWYQRYCEIFARSIPPLLATGHLKPHHVTDCLSQHTAWSSTTKNQLCRAVQRAFRWAEREQRILRSPIAHIEKPKCMRREVVITPAEFDDILAAVTGEGFRDLLITAWETGARPHELLTVEARHVDSTLARWVFPVSESKGQRQPRVVYLSRTALEITQRRRLRFPTGPLLRNENDQPWRRFAVQCAFSRLQLTMGRRRMKENGVNIARPPRYCANTLSTGERLAARATQNTRLREYRKTLLQTARKHARKYCLYHFRHSWATRALQRGVDPLTVAILMGHADPSMLAKVYQHLAQDPDFLRQAATKATG